MADHRNEPFTIRAEGMGQTGTALVLGSMSAPGHSRNGLVTSGADALVDLPDAAFVERWRLITGEPPAILLSSRAEMLALLVESTPAAPLEPPALAWDSSAVGTPEVR
ncbi:hypothetical protein MRF4_15255 [Methylobacterium radiotolerans]|uniref:Uncharacterized protein n=1 Tax=Methylobacterium oryzae TaxID=334852 RepID=A0ABU7TR63_9HYPH